jgi:hypothetical protein
MPIKRLQPVKSVVAGEPLKPVKSAVNRTPAERLERVDLQIAEITARIRRLRVLAVSAIVTGLAIFVAVLLVTWIFTDYIVLWGLPVVLLGAGVGGFCAKTNAGLGNELLVLNRERRALAKEVPDRPYGHAPAETP